MHGKLTRRSRALLDGICAGQHGRRAGRTVSLLAVRARASILRALMPGGEEVTDYYSMEATFTYMMSVEDQAPIGDYIDCVVDHLENELGVSDVQVVLDKGGQSFTISLLAPALAQDSAEAIVGRGMGEIRTALHACGVGTPSWPTPDDLKLGGVSLQRVTVKLNART